MMTVIIVIGFAPMTITMTTIKVMMTLMLMTMTASNDDYNKQNDDERDNGCYDCDNALGDDK